MAKSETPARDALIAKYLNEAYGKEKQLETALKLQIGLAKRPAVKKALQDHHKVTKAQAQGLKKRIRELGGKAEEPSLPGPDAVAEVAGAATSAANKVIAAAKGPVQALRGTSPADNELRNVRDCLWNEAEEIAHYDVIEAVAEQLGDKDTVKLAKAYRRQEEQMARVLKREVPKILKEVIKEEVPKEERPTSGRRRSSTTSRSTSSRSASSRATSARGTAGRSTSGSSSSRSSSSGRGTTKSAGTRGAATKSGATRSATTKSTGTRASGTSNGRAKSGSSSSSSRRSASSSGSGSKST